MSLEGVRLGFVLTGSHCTLVRVLSVIERSVVEGADVTPVLSTAVHTTDTRFGEASSWYNQLRQITGKDPVTTIVDAEPIGPKKLFDLLVVAPCTGNTLAKLANGITDTAALMAVKAHLRNQRPVVIAVSTNDGLGINARNIATLVNFKGIYFVPFGQDNPSEKPCSLVAKFEMLPETVMMALQRKQLQPLLIEYGK